MCIRDSCPWALREGLILRQLDVLAEPSLPDSIGAGVDV
jgi:hypothetical protein